MPDFKLPDGLGWPTQEPQDAERRRQEELERRIEAIRGARGRLSKLLAPLLDRKAEFRGAAVGVGCGVVRSVYQACVHQRVQCGRPEHLSAGGLGYGYGVGMGRQFKGPRLAPESRSELNRY